MKKGPTSRSYFSQRLKLHYLDWGEPDSTPVLLVHGSQDHCHSWDWTSELLSKKYRLLVPDLRGHGDSAWAIGSSYGSLDYVYDIHQLLEQAGLKQAHVIGHSLGGMIACLYAGLYPENVLSLTSIEGVGAFWQEVQEKSGPKTKIREWFSQAKTLAGRIPRRYGSLDAAFERMQESNPHLSEDHARHLTLHGSHLNEDGSFTWKFDPYTYSWPPMGLPFNETIQIWKQIRCPTLLLNATDGLEHRTGQDGTLEWFRDAVSLEIGDAGHWLHHDQFDLFVKNLKQFLSKADEPQQPSGRR